MVAGMQEYTAVKALYEFDQKDTYDLIILDTPPSRDALRFLDAPDRASAFLDRRIFNLFVPGEGGAIRRLATKLLERVMDLSFGRDTRVELQQFFQLFGALLFQLNHNQAEMKRFFESDSVAFVLVTSPAEAALTEAKFFARRATVELGLNVAGVMLNKSLAHAESWSMPEAGDDLDVSLASALKKLRTFADREREAMEAHSQLARGLLDLTAQMGWVCRLPHLGPDASTLDGLVSLAHCMSAGTTILNGNEKGRILS
jgi:anion-transporting  ArsA/GET3 family ATPase